MIINLTHDLDFDDEDSQINIVSNGGKIKFIQSGDDGTGIVIDTEGKTAEQIQEEINKMLSDNNIESTYISVKTDSSNEIYLRIKSKKDD